MPCTVIPGARPERGHNSPASSLLSYKDAVIGVSLGEGEVSRNSPRGSAKPKVLQVETLPATSLPLRPAQRRLRQAVRLRIVFPRHVRDGELQRPRQLPAGPVQRVEPRTAADILPGHLPDHYFRIGIYVQFVGFERHRVLQGFHQGGILGHVVVLVADPLSDAHRAAGAAANDDSNARRTRIPQATAVHIGHKLGHHDFCCCLQDAPIWFLRQDDYLIPDHQFPVDLSLVHFCVQKREKFLVLGDKVLPYSNLHLAFFTAWLQSVAPKVCVNFYERSVKVACVDGRKGWHNNTEPVRSRLSDQPGGATCKATRPEKTDGSARGSRGLELRKQ